MLSAFKEHIASSFPELFRKRLLLACSGGVDSTVLVHLCAACNLDFAIAHCNFGLRNAESDADEKFVIELAESLGRACHTTRFETMAYVASHNTSVQMAARTLRYSWFSEVLSEHDLDILLTAHQADDQLETFLINLSRGTGLEGLKGIPARSAALARPLLPFSRASILEYAKSEKFKWREDSSNKETKYIRNKIRHGLLPLLDELHPAFQENFNKTLGHLAGSSSLLADYRTHLKKELFLEKDDHIRIPVASLRKLTPQGDYLHFLFSEYGFNDLPALRDLLVAGSGKLLLSRHYRLVKDRDFLLLQQITAEDEQVYSIRAEEGSIRVPLRISIAEVGAMGEQSPDILYVDKETLNPVLTLRKWKKGDYFYPLGMKGRKRVAKYYKDEKMDIIAKENQWLLCSGDAIVWIVGRRADERFKVRPNTTCTLKITGRP